MRYWECVRYKDDYGMVSDLKEFNPLSGETNVNNFLGKSCQRH